MPTKLASLNVWKVDYKGTKQSLIAMVQLWDNGNLYWTHKNGYSDQTNASISDFDRITKRYQKRNDVIFVGDGES